MAGWKRRDLHSERRAAIRQNLERRGQEFEAFDAEAAMDGLPAKLPANFVPFTIGIDDLPHLILRLAGITKSDANAEQRVNQAPTRRSSGPAKS